MKRIAEILGVSRSNLLRSPRARVPKRLDDMELLARIRPVTDARPSYGYRRTAALVSNDGGPRVNHKRVYRVMKANGLLLARFTGKPGRTHEGKVITLKSDIRWCSDSFEIRCWNGERVQVAFAMDCCDREIMSWVATREGVTGEMIRDLMATAVESRFGAQAQRVPNPLQWLSDNGPPYTAHETRRFGASLGLTVCTTPAYSPESNGMAEAFVKTFKRDYVYLNNIDSAVTVMAQLAAWFEDYNEVHPHRGLRMKSPRQYRKQQLTA